MGIYKETIGILDEALGSIQNNLYESGTAIFNDTFFNLAFSLSICYLGYLIMFQKVKVDESVYKLIWTIIIFAIVKSILAKHSFYDYFLEIINAPANTLIQMLNRFVSGVNADASLENVTENLITSLQNVHDTIYSKASFSNLSAYIYATLLYLCGSFLLIAILLFSAFSLFLAKTVLALVPFIIIFLLWRKTEYIFFNWLRLYVSLSLYPAMTILLGSVCFAVAEYMKRVSSGLADGGYDQVIAICIIMSLCGLAIFKIPNIINQIIGSANEGSSLSSGLGTMSAGAAVLSTVSKLSLTKFAGESAGKALGVGLDKGFNKATQKSADAVKKLWTKLK
ncbi:conjugal transfer protein TrbL [Arcobacter sp. CECT 8986]|uniref:type IV secretion system protein n=1 Tax=Arcobacter sp. CECT 8986 TaxID=2044507 RepID=UPI001009A2A7|nr:type IV secretion system protein [Arcobacter sp. CECT 8986]RXK00450.1 conjugal transfer protein TrbL [Arcobacter sp. CECT 8986]